MNDDERDFKVVRSVVYTMRLLGERPSAAKVIAALQAISGRGMRKTDVCRHMKTLYDVEAAEMPCGNRSGTERELSGTEREPILSTAGTEREQTGTEREHHARVINTKLEIETRNIPPTPNGVVPPARPQKATVAEVTFEQDDERRVGSIIALVAAENKTGLIAPSRVLTLRGEMRARLDEYGAPCWRNGMDVAISSGKPWQYAAAVMRNNPAGAPPRPASRGAPRQEYKSLQMSDEKLSMLEQVARKHAIRPRSELLGGEQEPADSGRLPV